MLKPARFVIALSVLSFVGLGSACAEQKGRKKVDKKAEEKKAKEKQAKEKKAKEKAAQAKEKKD